MLLFLDMYLQGMNMSATNIPDWVQKRNVEIKKDAIPKGYDGYFNLSQGENLVSIDLSVEPKTTQGQYGKRYNYTVIINGKKFIMSVSGMLDKLINFSLMTGKTDMCIIRIGEGKATRYSIKL